LKSAGRYAKQVKVIDGDRPARRGWLRPVTDPWRGGIK
jgi:hypothetical protein